MTRRRRLGALLFLLSTFFVGVISPATAADPVLPAGVSRERVAVETMWQAFRELPADQRPRVILVLGGGGARGLCHIGVLRVFKEENIPIDEVVGVSVGALIGALHCSGLPPEKIEMMAADVGWSNLTDFSRVSLLKMILTENLFSTTRMETYLNQHIGPKYFSDLKTKFSCVATDLRTGERVVLDEGPVAISARASATIPGLFTPVEYRQRYLVDGGLVDNLPTDISSKGPFDVIVGVLPKVEERHDEASNMFMVLVRSIEIQRNVIIGTRRKSADLLIEPNVGMMSIIDLGKTKEAIEAGTVAARDQALELKKMLIKKTLEMRAAATKPKAANR